ncbi:MAG: GNAT family N-acetyltransferase [Alphaproteobacteria bacterium]|nr:GNAT family N-acetyltransferase [Alphaproteobacteria bacterium]
MDFHIDDLNGKEIKALLREHLDDMFFHTPPESVHALDLKSLQASNITFWSVWKEGNLAGCGALKELDKSHGEIKSMRTSRSHLRQGVAAKLLNHILSEAKKRSYSRISLETGSMDVFIPAQKLYKKFGFKECAPFDGYKEDPNSMFMTKYI